MATTLHSKHRFLEEFLDNDVFMTNEHLLTSLKPGGSNGVRSCDIAFEANDDRRCFEETMKKFDEREL